MRGRFLNHFLSETPISSNNIGFGIIANHIALKPLYSLSCTTYVPKSPIVLIALHCLTYAALFKSLYVNVYIYTHTDKHIFFADIKV